MSDVMKKLQAPFDPMDIEWRVGSTTGDKTKGLALAYVTNRAIQNRLDEVFGPFGWQNEFREWKGSSQICGISVWDNTKNQWITKWDGADDSQTEAVKGGLSDSMKRAGYQWGIGRYLYNLPSVWVPIKQQGKSYVIEKEPILPDWALPEGYKKTPKQDKMGQEVPFTPEDLPPGFDDVPKASEAQLKKIYAISKSLNLDTDAMVTIMLERYTKENSKELTKKEASDLIGYLDNK